MGEWLRMTRHVYGAWWTRTGTPGGCNAVGDDSDATKAYVINMAALPRINGTVSPNLSALPCAVVKT